MLGRHEIHGDRVKYTAVECLLIDHLLTTKAKC